MSKLLFSALCLAVITGCTAESPTPTQLSGVLVNAGEVTATRVTAGVQVVNGTSAGVAYLVANQGWLGLLGTCNDPGPSCVRLGPGESVVVPFSEIAGWDKNATEAVVYWWYVLPDGDGSYRAGDVVAILAS